MNEPHEFSPLLGWRRSNLRERGGFINWEGEDEIKMKDKRGLYKGRGGR